MASKAEAHVSQSLRELVANLAPGDSILDSPTLRDFLSGLDFFLTEVLQEIHSEWKYESLDGIFPLIARKTGELEAEVFGESILISDQTLTPMHVVLQASASGDEISWLELNLGEVGQQGMVRTPYQSPTTAMKRVYRLSERDPAAIEWCYKAGFGERRL